MWRDADGYVTITQGIVDHMTSLGATTVGPAVVPDGMRHVPADPGPLPSEPLIGYAGHLYAWKGVDVILQALPLAPRRSRAHRRRPREGTGPGAA